MFSLLVDIDRLTPLPAVNHAGREDETLRRFAGRLAHEAGIERPARRVLLLAYPRIFG